MPSPLEQSRSQRRTRGQTASALARSNYRIRDIWKRRRSESIANCWGAIDNIINQCARGGYGAGSWVAGTESYLLTATTHGYRQRSGPPPLPSLSGTIDEIALTNGTCTLDGKSISLHVGGLDFKHDEYALSKRSDKILLTNYGPASNWTLVTQHRVDLSAIIREVVEKALQGSGSGLESRDIARRAQYCRPDSSRYVLLEAGYWDHEAEPASPPYECGRNFKCSAARTWSKTWTESFNIGLSGGAASSERNAALSLGYGWERSSSQGGQFECEWNTGGCHVLYSKQYMTWQRGFRFAASANEWFTAVSVDLVHGDAPRHNEPSYECFRGCCGPKTPHIWTHFCQYATGKEEWYGVCNNYDVHPKDPACNW